MNSLRRLTLAVCLAIATAGAVFAGETNTPPCPNPGESSTPPRTSTQQITDQVSERSSDVPEVETVVLEAASYAIVSLLTFF